MTIARRPLSGWGALLLLVPFVLMGADWPQFLGPRRDGTSTETGLVNGWPAKGPPVLWERTVGEGYSGPVEVGSQLILFHRVDAKEVIESLHATTGKRRWIYQYPTTYSDSYGKGDGPRATPVVADGRVYTLGAGGILTCLGLEKGEKIWQVHLQTKFDCRSNFFGVASSPLVEGDKVIVNVGARKAGIVAFGAKTGVVRWRSTTKDASYASPIAATIGGKRYLFVWTRRDLVALDPKDGKVRFTRTWWARFSASVNAATPLVIKDHLFISASYRTGALLLQITADGPRDVWKGDSSLSAHYNTPVYVDGFLYGIDGRQETGARLRCVEWKTGKVRWSKEGFGCASLIAADNKLIAMTEKGDLVLVNLDPTRYREKARASVLGSPCRSPIALARGRLYARGPRKLVCWNLNK